MEKKLIIFPTYNEAQNLPVIIEEIKEYVDKNTSILVVDDNSPDGTGKIADELAKKNKDIHILHRETKNGLGAAYTEAFKWGLNKGYDLLIQMDVDGSHRPCDLPKLVDVIESDPDIDLVIGSRWVQGGETVNWPKSRIILSRGGSLWSNFIMGLGVNDPTAGFRIYRRRVFEKYINLNNITTKGFGFQIDNTAKIIYKGGKIVEVPITFVERELGESKMDNSIIIEAIFMTTKTGIKHRLIQLKHLFYGKGE
ncbi:MAG: polyprenol monophosphomannose synthase [Bifidobacteriaceae bacterium]|jgi:dolichol-phosphate mannosyltransferase|nr:polyprenol monophosphomannose synthase [Bifidobacteriaceae bacterium]